MCMFVAIHDLTECKPAEWDFTKCFIMDQVIKLCFFRNRVLFLRYWSLQREEIAIIDNNFIISGRFAYCLYWLIIWHFNLFGLLTLWLRILAVIYNLTECKPAGRNITKCFFIDLVIKPVFLNRILFFHSWRLIKLVYPRSQHSASSVSFSSQNSKILM